LLFSGLVKINVCSSLYLSYDVHGIFPYKGQLYHIITDFRKTFLTKVENKRFVTIDLIANESIWTYNPEIIRTAGNHFIVFFNNDKVNGFLDIVDNKINLIRYR